MARSRVTNPETVSALRTLVQQKRGRVHPADVVEAAREESSPLHRHFEWDDGKAAEQYRIEQARSLLQTVHVEMVGADGTNEPVQMFVSLTSDRDEGGYRMMVDVLSDADMRRQMIRDAMSDMQAFAERYKTLRELAQVFAAMRRAKKKLVPAA